MKRKGWKVERLESWPTVLLPAFQPFSLPAFPHLLHTSPVLNIAGPDYDYGSVVFVVLQECEHRRRGWEADEFENPGQRHGRKRSWPRSKARTTSSAGRRVTGKRWKRKSWTVVVAAVREHARDFNESEKKTFGVWRGGDPARARLRPDRPSSSAVSSSPSLDSHRRGPLRVRPHRRRSVVIPTSSASPRNGGTPGSSTASSPTAARIRKTPACIT